MDVMATAISISETTARRAILQTASKRWSRNEKNKIYPIIKPDTETSNEDSVEIWLTAISNNPTVTNTARLPCLRDNGNPEAVLETTVKPMRRNESEDDLVLGEEASSDGKHSLRRVRDILRSSLDPPALSRWNSFASNVSVPSDVSIMDVLNILQDDPEELLFDLGFGTEEPDITGRIPARFLNYKSTARGISLQVFLEAQQNRMDIENTDVRNRFRQLEVLHQVTTTFSSLVGANEKDTSASTASAEARERRKRMAVILRRAYKKSLSQDQTSQNQHQPPPPSIPASQGTQTTDKRVSKRTRMLDNSSLFPLEEEDHVNSEAVNLNSKSSMVRGPSDLLRFESGQFSTKGFALTVESFELEEIQSFDDGGASGRSNVPVDSEGHRIGSNVMRTNSCQSDSSGFQEEPFIPALSQQNNPELMKMLSAISQDSAESPQKNPSTQNCESQSRHKCTPRAHSNQTPGTRTVFDSDSGYLRKVETENDSSSPSINKVSKNVYTLAYCVQMDPIRFPDRSVLKTPDRRIHKEAVSLYEELKSAEENSLISETDLRTDVVKKEFEGYPNLSEVGKTDSVLDLLWESTIGKHVTSEPALGSASTALKLKRESFSRRSWSGMVTDDSGTAQTPPTQTPFTSVDTSPPQEFSGELGCFCARSVSVDTELSYEEEDQRLQGALWAGERCFHCGSQISYENQLEKPELPYSLDELEEMMRCLRKFRTILTQIEVRLEEDQASLFGSLSNSLREEVEYILQLRAAVKQEAGMLEQQLSDLVHNYDDSIKMKLNRLMDEQSQLCTQLRIAPSESPPSPPTSSRSVGVQCCLLSKLASPCHCVHHHCSCQRSQAAAGQDPLSFPCQIQWDAHHKPNKLDFVAFIKSLRYSLQHSINTNSPE